MRKCKAAFAAIGLLPLLSSAAIGQDWAGEGKFSITYTGVNPTPSKPVAFGKDREVTAQNSRRKAKSAAQKPVATQTDVAACVARTDPRYHHYCYRRER